MNRGRPLKFATSEELQSKIDKYFELTPIELQTITGLALHLDTSRETLMEYQERPDFIDTVKKAKLRIEHAYEIRGMEKGGAFDIFRLKNMGWKDKYENELSGGIEMKKPSWFEDVK